MTLFSKSKVSIPCCITLLFLCCSSWLAAQDIIVKKDGVEIPCKVLELDPPKIKYRPTSHADGPIRTLYYREVFMIKYGNGTKEVLDQNSNTNSSNSSDNNPSLTEKPNNQWIDAFKYPLRPWNVGIGATSINMYEFFAGGKLSVGYTYQPVPFRLQVDGVVGMPIGRFSNFSTPMFAANLGLQYVIYLGEGAVELAPEVGIGIWYQESNPFYTTVFPMVMLGANLDLRLSDLLSLRINPRYRSTFAENDPGAFEGHLGLCFLIGKY